MCRGDLPDQKFDLLRPPEGSKSCENSVAERCGNAHCCASCPAVGCNCCSQPRPRILPGGDRACASAKKSRDSRPVHLPVQIINASDGGCQIECEEPLPIGAAVSLRLQLVSVAATCAGLYSARWDYASSSSPNIDVRFSTIQTLAGNLRGFRAGRSRPSLLRFTNCGPHGRGSLSTDSALEVKTRLTPVRRPPPESALPREGPLNFARLASGSSCACHYLTLVKKARLAHPSG